MLGIAKLWGDEERGGEKVAYKVLDKALFKDSTQFSGIKFYRFFGFETDYYPLD